MKSKHADLLNALDEMQQSPAYALRRDVLRKSERLIADQERRLEVMHELQDELLVACDSARVELMWLIQQNQSRPGGSVDRAYRKCVDIIEKVTT